MSLCVLFLNSICSTKLSTFSFHMYLN